VCVWVCGDGVGGGLGRGGCECVLMV
jgi:hypothetical protein